MYPSTFSAAGFPFTNKYALLDLWTKDTTTDKNLTVLILGFFFYITTHMFMILFSQWCYTFKTNLRGKYYNNSFATLCKALHLNKLLCSNEGDFWCITCAVVSPGLPSWVCSLSWTLSAELLEGEAEEGCAPPARAAGVGRGGLAAMAGLGGRLPMGRSETEGFGWRGRGRSGWMRSSALKGCLGSARYRRWERE